MSLVTLNIKSLHTNFPDHEGIVHRKSLTHPLKKPFTVKTCMRQPLLGQLKVFVLERWLSYETPLQNYHKPIFGRSLQVFSFCSHCECYF